MLVPKLVTTLKTYTRSQFLADLTAGAIVGIVALPLAIAFATATLITRELQDTSPAPDHTGAIYRRRIPPGVEVYEIKGPCFFGAAERMAPPCSSPTSTRSRV